MAGRVTVFAGRDASAAAASAALEIAAEGVVCGRLSWSLPELERAVIADVVGAGRVLSPAEERVLLWEYAAELPEPWAAARRSVGLTRALGNYLRSLGQQQHVGAQGSDAWSALGAGWMGLLKRVGRLDHAGAVWAATDALARGGRLSPRFVLDADWDVVGLVAPYPSRVALLNALASRLAGTSRMTLDIPFADEDDPCGSAGRELLGMLERQQIGLEVEVMPRPLRGAAELPACELVSAPDVHAEVRGVARWVRGLVEAGCPPRDVAIAAPRLDVYRMPLLEALASAGVPAMCRQGSAAMDSGLVRWTRGALALAAAGWPRAELTDWLLDAHGRTLWEAVIGAWEPTLWRAALNRVAEPRAQCLLPDVRRRLSSVREQVGAGAVGSLSAVLAWLEQALPWMAHPTATPGVWISGLRDVPRVLMLDASVRRWRQDNALRDAWWQLEHATDGAHEVVRAVARDEEALDAWDRAIDALETGTRLLPNEALLGRGEVLAWLDAALAEARLAPLANDAGGVCVLALDEMPGLHATHAAVVGLTNASLPLRSRSLVRDGERVGLEANGAGAPLEAVSSDPLPLWLRLAMEAASDSVWLTWPRSDTAGRALLPAPALALLERGGFVSTVRTMGSESVPRADAVAGEEDLRRWAVRFGQTDGLELDALAARARIERERMAWFAMPDAAPNRFGGLLDDAAALDAWRRRELGSAKRPWSASALEEFSRCGFRGFAARGLRLAELDEVSEDLSARDGGEAAHVMLAAALARCSQRGLERFVAADAAQAEAVAADVVTLVAAGWLERSGLDPVWARPMLRDTARRVVGLVRALYEADDGFAPVAFEQGFGGAEGWPALVVAGDDGRRVHVTGRIDVVERKGDSVRISDLKRGGADSVRRALDPERLLVDSFQLPLYAAAAAQALGTVDLDVRYLPLADMAPAPSLAAQRSNPRSKWRSVPRTSETLLRADTVPDEVPALRDAVLSVDSWVRGGTFAARPLPDACEYCAFGNVCRIVERAQDEAGE